ncbi:MAG TPA: GNAT family protein [Chloroflexia bacterium]|nr:GNAT family protein [Chloroflexia bacterium]
MQRDILQIEDVFADLPTLETVRLLLRKVTPDDAQDVFEYAIDPEVARYTTWEPHQSIEDSRLFVARLMEGYAAGKVTTWGMVHKADSKLIGMCGFAEWIPYHARAEVGYAMSRKYWGQGLMTEAVRAVIAFGFETMRLNRVEARCLVENVGSARVMEKAGMRFEGILRQHMYAKGTYDDLKMYSILRQEWNGQ